MVEKIGHATWNKSAKMYAEMDQWQTDTLKAPFSSEVYRWIGEAVEVGRSRGLIAPRVGQQAAGP
jgi:hypothetical protein